MSEAVTIKVAKIVGSAICVASEDGQKVFEAIVEALRSGRMVQLSFEAVEDLTSAFLNAAVGQLYGEFSEEEIKASLSVVNIAPEDLLILKRTVDRAKEYFKDPERFHAAVRDAVGDDES